MIDNIFDAEELRSLARRKNHDRDFRTVRNQEVAEQQSEGWEIQQQNKTSTRLSSRMMKK
jgi:hypothetical protein